MKSFVHLQLKACMSNRHFKGTSCILSLRSKSQQLGNYVSPLGKLEMKKLVRSWLDYICIYLFF